MTKTISCPVCENQCSPQAVFCPKCGHPFTKQNVNEKASPATNSQKSSESSNTKRLLTVVLGVVSFCLLSYGIYYFYSYSKTYNLSKNTNASKGLTIPIKVALIYKMGVSQPVARTKFYLLNQDFEGILKKNPLAMYRPVDTRPPDYWGYVSNKPAPTPISTVAGIDESEIRMNKIATATTDFEGNAKFDNVPPGTYYVVGFTTTRSKDGFVVWSVKVNASKNTDVILLEQNNAFRIED